MGRNDDPEEDFELYLGADGFFHFVGEDDAPEAESPDSGIDDDDGILFDPYEDDEDEEDES